MITFYKKYWRTAFDISLIALTVYLIMLAFSYLYNIAAPIFLSFIIFLIIEPLARFLHRRKIKKSVATTLSMLLFILIVLVVLTAASAVFITQIDNLTNKLPIYSEILQEQVTKNTDYIQEKIEALPQNLTEKAEEYIKFVTKKGSDLATWFLQILLHFLSSLSTFMVNFVVAVILAYFLSIEIESWKKIASQKTPKTFKSAFFFLKDNVLIGIGSYIKAQLKLISITFITVFIGLLLLGVHNSFSIALLSAFFDVLPLLGVSAVFVPWIIYLFVTGSLQLAIWLCILLGVVIVTRQILEPKITGDSLGVSAFTMLSFMIISLSLFGVAGVILSPILIILIKSLYDQGYLRRWIRLPEEEY